MVEHKDFTAQNYDIMKLHQRLVLANRELIYHYNAIIYLDREKMPKMTTTVHVDNLRKGRKDTVEVYLRSSILFRSI